MILQVSQKCFSPELQIHDRISTLPMNKKQLPFELQVCTHSQFIYLFNFELSVHCKVLSIYSG
jgi:hypothetical protein